MYNESKFLTFRPHSFRSLECLYFTALKTAGKAVTEFSSSKNLEAPKFFFKTKVREPALFAARLRNSLFFKDFPPFSEEVLT